MTCLKTTQMASSTVQIRTQSIEPQFLTASRRSSCFLDVKVPGKHSKDAKSLTGLATPELGLRLHLGLTFLMEVSCTLSPAGPATPTRPVLAGFSVQVLRPESQVFSPSLSHSTPILAAGQAGKGTVCRPCPPWSFRAPGEPYSYGSLPSISVDRLSLPEPWVPKDSDPPVPCFLSPAAPIRKGTQDLSIQCPHPCTAGRPSSLPLILPPDSFFLLHLHLPLHLCLPSCCARTRASQSSYLEMEEMTDQI